jgi:hypothetical protein
MTTSHNGDRAVIDLDIALEASCSGDSLGSCRVVHVGTCVFVWCGALQMKMHNLDLSARKHCFLAVFVLWDRRHPDSFFQPYYRMCYLMLCVCPLASAGCHP